MREEGGDGREIESEREKRERAQCGKIKSG